MTQPTSSGKCDLCNGNMGAPSGRFTSDQMRAAVKKGLRPAPLDEVAVFLGRKDDSEEWFQMVENGTVDWSVCQECNQMLFSLVGAAPAVKEAEEAESEPDPPQVEEIVSEAPPERHPVIIRADELRFSDLDGAAAMVEGLVREDDDLAARVGAFDLLGQMYLTAGDLDSAREAFERNLETYPNARGTFAYLGLINELEGAFDEAEEWYEKCPERSFDPQFKNQVANAYRERSKGSQEGLNRLDLLILRDILPPLSEIPLPEEREEPEDSVEEVVVRPRHGAPVPAQSFWDVNFKQLGCFFGVCTFTVGVLHLLGVLTMQEENGRILVPLKVTGGILIGMAAGLVISVSCHLLIPRKKRK